MLVAGLISCPNAIAQQSPIVTVSATETRQNSMDEPAAKNFAERAFANDQFSIQTSVTAKGIVEQTCRTIFREGLAVQVTGDGSRFLTIYGDESVTMLDRMKGVRCIIEHEHLIDITDRTATMIRDTKRRQSLGVDVVPRRVGDTYIADFGPFHYRITSVHPTLSRMVTDYAKTADAAARLNLVRSTGLPPFGRLAISREMVRDGRLPIETKLTIQSDRGKAQTFISINALTPWNETDQERFESALSMQSIYQDVTMDQFEPF